MAVRILLHCSYSPSAMKTTYEADDGQHFKSEKCCMEYERLLPILRDIIDGIQTIELGECEALSFLRDLKTRVNPSYLERYLFDHRKEFARLADMLNPVDEG
jgi:hypothetical protein